MLFFFTFCSVDVSDGMEFVERLRIWTSILFRGFQICGQVENWRSRLRQLVIESKQDDTILILKQRRFWQWGLRQLLIGTYDLNVTLQQHFDRDNNQLVLSIENGLAEDFLPNHLVWKPVSETAQVHHALMVSTNIQLEGYPLSITNEEGFDRGHLAMLWSDTWKNWILLFP